MASSSWDWTARRRVRFYIRQAIRHRPRVYFPLVRRRKRPYMLVNGARMVHTGVVHDGTRIVIEGYPRCGNTFATVAFQLAQGVPVEAAHHLHAEAQIVAAAESGIPAVLLIRDDLRGVHIILLRISNPLAATQFVLFPTAALQKKVTFPRDTRV